MPSSETKMVVGAACLEGNDSSATAFFMNNASDVMTVSNASIYIDGGFGRLTLQSGDYAGGVSAIAGAGDAADIDADGLVVDCSGPRYPDGRKPIPRCGPRLSWRLP